MSRRTLVPSVIVVIAVVVAGAWLLQKQDRIDPELDASLDVSQAAPPPPETAAESEANGGEPIPEGAQQESSSSAARSVTRVPIIDAAEVGDPPPSEVLAAEPEELAGLLTKFLGSALEGDLRSANEVARIRRRCSGTPRTRKALEERLTQFEQRRQWFQNSGEAIPQPNIEGLRPGPWQMMADADENRINQERWFSSCQPVWGAFAGDFRSELEALARRGDVVARFLYSTWPPAEEMSTVPFDLQMHWENTAREFSNLNLDAGEPAGILAYSRSYYEGLFTTRNFEFGVAGAITALGCGYRDPWLEFWVERQLEPPVQADISPEAEQKLRERQLRILETVDVMSRYCR